MSNNEIMVINKNDIKDKIYEIRGQKVMLDFVLAEIYGYETKRLKEQIKNNIMKFPADFMFKLNSIEFNQILRSEKSASSCK